MMGIPGGPELFIVLAAVGLVLFGPKQLPKIARSVGEAIREWKTVRREIDEDVNEVKKDLE